MEKPKPRCATSVDLGFVLDASNSLKLDFHKEKAFLQKIAEEFDISNSGTRAGVVTFSDETQLSIKLDDTRNLTSFNTAVDAIPLMGDTTRIDKALRLAQNQLFLESNGGRFGIPKVLIILTDGSQTEGDDHEDPADIAREIRATGIRLLVIGFGFDVDPLELLQIAGDESNVFAAR